MRPIRRNSARGRLAACKPNEIILEPDYNQDTNKTFWDKMWKLPNIIISGPFSSAELPPPSRDYVIGMAGFWLMAGEAHITTIGVRNICRQQGVGERLLISVIDMATQMKADIWRLV